METPPPRYHSDDEDDLDSNLSESTATLDSSHEDPDPVVTIHTAGDAGILVKVQPPSQPLNPAIDHVPCDIVLVIDVSLSMADDAPPPAAANGGGEKERSGLSILDLTKHAARTIISTLNEGDRLGIVTFGWEAKVIQELIPMEKAHKEEVDAKIENMIVDGPTNLWSGIKTGLGLFQHDDAGGSVKALMVLTDGLPNHIGYVKMLRDLGPLPAMINTFGFGYDIESGLLKSIAEAGSGNYAFIPDAGMIGTVFVHAVAHLQSTYATRCMLTISAPRGALLRSKTGRSIDEPKDEMDGNGTVTIKLGNLQYGQSRDIYLENVDECRLPTKFRLQGENRIVAVKLTYSRMQSPEYVVFADQDMLETSPLPSWEIAYHQSRSMICELLSSFFTLSASHTYAVSFEHFRNYQQRLHIVLDAIQARWYEDQYNVSLMKDLNGQIREALSEEGYFNKWGRHYFLSLWSAHAKQLCNSFKDPGPLMYNDNPFFTKCCDVLDKAFDNIPPPKPSNGRCTISSNRNGARPSDASRARPSDASRAIFSMRVYNNRNDRCFAASSLVLLAAGVEVPVCTLQQGMMVQTPVGPRHVRAVLKSRVHESAMCRVGNLIVTPWHPINIGQSKHESCGQGGWTFPIDVAEQTITYSGVICSVLLEPDDNVDAHAIHVGGVWGVALGHGVLSGSDVRAHPFFGDYCAVSKDLSGSGPGENGVYWGTGTRRDANTGLVCSWLLEDRRTAR
ncbi:U-box domain-containing protein [Xylaria cf. heliscus]|nr:U-box domain-containing protein [Xylaria cf. heliscus]